MRTAKTEDVVVSAAVLAGFLLIIWQLYAAAQGDPRLMGFLALAVLLGVFALIAVLETMMALFRYIVRTRK